MQIRPFQEPDEPAVIELWNESSPAHTPHNDPATAIRKKLEVGRDLFFVAEVDGTLSYHGREVLRYAKKQPRLE